MYRKYRTKSGIIDAWYSDLGYLTVTDRTTGVDIAEYKFDEYDPEATFNHNNEVIRVEDFIFDDLDTMISIIETAVDNKKRYAVRKGELLATFLKESEKVGVMMQGHSGEILMIPVERRYNKSDWEYKIEFIPAETCGETNEDVETIYFDTLLEYLLKGTFKLANLEKD